MRTVQQWFDEYGESHSHPRNELLHIMDRAMGTILSSFGQPGHENGKFTFLHSVAKDSKGNLYTGETINGRRVLKLKHIECNAGQGRGQGQGNCS